MILKYSTPSSIIAVESVNKPTTFSGITAAKVNINAEKAILKNTAATDNLLTGSVLFSPQY